MDADKAKERVLVIPESRFREAGIFHGFRTYSPEFLATLLDPQHLSYRPRGEVETDPSFKQLIPYIVLRCGKEIFHYTRGSGGGEKRLQSLRSIGIGGHINQEDAILTVDMDIIRRRVETEKHGGLKSAPLAADPYRAGMMRELAEEVEIDSPYKERCIGFIYDGTTPVGEVHLGVVHLLDLEEPLAWPRETAIDEAGFAPLPELLRHREEFETWSIFAMEELARSRG